MKSVNKVILVGNVGKDPETKYTPSGTCVSKFSLATTEKYKDKGGEWQEKTEWHNVVAWAKLGEIAGEYVKKGAKLYLEGKLTTNSWDDQKTGEKKYRMEIVANDLVFFGGEKRERQERSEPVAARPAQNDYITDDDLPF